MRDEIRERGGRWTVDSKKNKRKRWICWKRKSGAGRFKGGISRNSDFRKFKKGTIDCGKATPMARGARRVEDRVALWGKRLECRWRCINRELIHLHKLTSWQR